MVSLVKEDNNKKNTKIGRSRATEERRREEKRRENRRQEQDNRS
jgi:hypothetical protein